MREGEPLGSQENDWEFAPGVSEQAPVPGDQDVPPVEDKIQPN
jgi:hypothetical protein